MNSVRFGPVCLVVHSFQARTPQGLESNVAIAYLTGQGVMDGAIAGYINQDVAGINDLLF